jgi:hypothetical protein
MFDVSAKEQCLIIYHCLPLRKKKQEQFKLPVNCAECSGNASFSDKGFVRAGTFYLQRDNVVPSCPWLSWRSKPCCNTLII